LSEAGRLEAKGAKFSLGAAPFGISRVNQPGGPILLDAARSLLERSGMAAALPAIFAAAKSIRGILRAYRQAMTVAVISRVALCPDIAVAVACDFVCECGLSARKEK